MAKGSFDNCPVCDNNLPEEQEVCPNCGALMKLFDIDFDINEGISKEAIEKVRSLILEEGEDEELVEEIKNLEFSGIVGEDEETTSSDKGEKIEEIVTFACPICDSEVEENDSQCPNCGAIFEEESDEETSDDEVEDISMEKREESIIGDEGKSGMVDFQDEIDFYQKRIDRFENSGLDMKYLKKDVSELKNAQNEGDEIKSKRIIDEIEDKIEYLENIMEITSKCDNFLSVLSEKMDVSEMEEKVEKIYEGCRIGEYEIASKRAKDMQKEIVGELEGLEKRWLDDFIKKRSKEARELISDIDSNFSIELVEEKIEEALSSKNSGDVEEWIHKIMEALDLASDISEISDRIEEANDYVEEISQRGIDCSKYEENIDKSKNEIGSEKMESAFKIIERTIEDMQSQLDQLEKKEGQDPKEMNEKIEKKIFEMESLLEQAEKFDIETTEGEEKIEEAGRYAEENKYEKGLSKLDEVEEMYRESVEKEIDKMIDSMKDEHEDLFEEVFPHEETEKLKKKGDYEEILDIIEEMEGDIDSQKEIKRDLTEDVSKIESIISYSENLDLEMNDVKALLEEVEEKIENRNWTEARDELESCEDTIEDKLVGFLKGEIRNAKNKLKGVNSDDFDITEPINLLKGANQARKEKKLEKSFEALKNYRQKMEKIFENS